MPDDKTFLRVLSCGSVDDGKSTLIGRMLHDLGTLYEDQLELLEKERTAGGPPDFSRLLDGLLAEREQAITIDVAHRSFTTGTRRYLVADAPGHEQYTRNMATGASRADAALLLIDAPRAGEGLLPQTIRHTMIAALFGVPHVVAAVNKMDCLGYAEAPFRRIEAEYLSRTEKLGFLSVACVPVSALMGDNVVNAGAAMPWYGGPTVMDILETVEPVVPKGGPFRMPVQWVARHGRFRGLSGTVVSGAVASGQAVKVMPSGAIATVKSIQTLDGELSRAEAEQAVCVELAEDVDACRGDLLADAGQPPETADQFAANIVWLDASPLVAGRTYLFRHGAVEGKATVTELSHRIDLTTLEPAPAKKLECNEMGRIKFALDRPIPFAPYAENRDLGCFLLIDRINAATQGAGMILNSLRRGHNIFWQDFALDKAAHAAQKGQTPRLLWFTGLSASGKSTLAGLVARALHARGRHVYTLDGDNLRFGLNKDLGFTERDRAENIRRASEAAALMVDAGLIVLASFISPYRKDRLAIRERFAPGEFVEIFVDTPIEVCARRDHKGLYAKAMAGQLPNFTGVTAPFEPPERPELHLDGRRPAEELAAKIIQFIDEHLG